jgi:undecaprenyl-diphosphatase
VTTGVALLVVAILLLSVAVHATRTALPGDLGVATAVQRLLPDGWLSHPLELLSVIGWPQYQTAALVALVGLLLVLRRRFGALVLLLACGCADGTSFVLNRLIQRPRPQAPGLVVDRHITNYFSFPSGHVVHFTVLCGLLLYLTFHPRATAPWWWPVRVLLLAWPLLMGLSRILTGEHWPSDVLGGYLVGLFWLVVSTQIYPWAAARWSQLLGRGDREREQERRPADGIGGRRPRAAPDRRPDAVQGAETASSAGRWR